MRTLLKKKSIRIALVLLVVAVAAMWVMSPTPAPSIGSGVPMKAVLYHEYGQAEVLRFEQSERPRLEHTHVLIKVRAASANPLDWHYMRGTPYVMRIGAGLRKPTDP